MVLFRQYKLNHYLVTDTHTSYSFHGWVYDIFTATWANSK